MSGNKTSVLSIDESIQRLPPSNMWSQVENYHPVSMKVLHWKCISVSQLSHV